MFLSCGDESLDTQIINSDNLNKNLLVKLPYNHYLSLKAKPDFPSSVLLKRVRYCSNYSVGICTKDETNYNQWEDNGVSDSNQKDTYIGVLSNVSKENVESVNIYFAGQQTGDGVSNVVTGQSEDYKSECKKGVVECVKPIDSKGLAAQIYKRNIFNHRKTFIAVVYDTQFNHMLLSGEKSDMEDAYYEWITSQFNDANIKNIYLAGSSRGGCLAMRLSKRFRTNYSSDNVKVIVSSFDGVCKRSQNEMGTTDTRDYNPYDDEKRGWHTDLDLEFPNKDNLNIYHISGGANAPIDGVRCFSYKDYNVDYNWYRQNWVNLEHTNIGRDYNSSLEDSEKTLIRSQVDFVDFKVHPVTLEYKLKEIEYIKVY